MIVFKYIPVVLLNGLVFWPMASGAQSPNTESNSGSMATASDCTEIDLSFKDGSPLTAEERIRLMDREFYRSVSKFDACLDEVAREMEQSSSSGGGSSGGGGGGGASSVASTSISGTEKESSDSTSDYNSQSGEISGTETSAVPETTESEIGENATTVSDNGKIPDDIPKADNDSILEAQIRQAAMNENDPEIREKLWDEYRRYKGIKK